jgi:hypothetical protein
MGSRMLLGENPRPAGGGGDFAGGGIKALVDGKLGRDAARERDRHRVLDELARRSASRARINA